MISPDFFPENPDGEFLPQEQVFLPLIESSSRPWARPPRSGWSAAPTISGRQARAATTTRRAARLSPCDRRALAGRRWLRLFGGGSESVFVKTTTISSTDVRTDLRTRGGDVAAGRSCELHRVTSSVPDDGRRSDRIRRPPHGMNDLRHGNSREPRSGRSARATDPLYPDARRSLARLAQLLRPDGVQSAVNLINLLIDKGRPLILYVGTGCSRSVHVETPNGVAPLPRPELASAAHGPVRDPPAESPARTGRRLATRFRLRKQRRPFDRSADLLQDDGTRSNSPGISASASTERAGCHHQPAGRAPPRRGLFVAAARGDARPAVRRHHHDELRHADHPVSDGEGCAASRSARLPLDYGVVSGGWLAASVLSAWQGGARHSCSTRATTAGS